jgi:hypothetical protein
MQLENTKFRMTFIRLNVTKGSRKNNFTLFSGLTLRPDRVVPLGKGFSRADVQ